MSTRAIIEALIAVAVRLLPAEERRRWRDEWLAELDAGRMSGALKVRFAFGICAGAGAMARGLHARRALLRTASVARSGFARPVTAARPPYNAGAEFWS